MNVNGIIFKELVKRGYSLKGKTRVWDVADSKLWYLTPELSEGFLNLAKYEPYRKVFVETELRLVKENAEKIISLFGKCNFNLVDLGCGGGLKTTAFIKSLPNNVNLRYCPVDISPYFINKSLGRVKMLKSKKVGAFKPFVSDFEDLDDIVGMLRNSDYPCNLILLLGGTISHYDINDFLFQLSRDMFKGDFLVVGNGYRVGKRFVNVDKYKTSLFNAWFIQVMKGLGFEENEVEYDARFANGRLEAFYRVLVDKKINYKGKKVSFRKGDEVVVAIQYKFYEKELMKFCKMYFSQVEFVSDKKREYCLLLCKK